MGKGMGRGRGKRIAETQLRREYHFDFCREKRALISSRRPILCEMMKIAFSHWQQARLENAAKYFQLRKTLQSKLKALNRLQPIFNQFKVITQ